MKQFLLSVFFTLLASTVYAQAKPVDPDQAFIDKAKDAVALLYSQNEAGGMQMRCTATAFEKNGDIYSFVTAAHCVGEDRTDKEKSADPKNIPFYLSFDESKGDKKFWPADVKFIGYQSRGEDFAVFEVKSKENWPTIVIGSESEIKDGAQYWNVASPLGLGRQIQEGIIANISLDRPIVEGSINWKGTMVLQQSGVNGGSSGSPIISKETHKIVGFLVGTIGNSTIIAIPVSRFTAVQKAVEGGKYKWYVREMNINPDGSEAK